MLDSIFITPFLSINLSLYALTREIKKELATLILKIFNIASIDIWICFSSFCQLESLELFKVEKIIESLYNVFKKSFTLMSFPTISFLNSLYIFISETFLNLEDQK